mmetsp:Transcript_74119/g.174043  ORF Transcript_74119/g.174043 Transcript_74119/m.174043 type:complete len:276 (-) Transcript_74119:264-1091(-)
MTDSETWQCREIHNLTSWNLQVKATQTTPSPRSRARALLALLQPGLKILPWKKRQKRQCRFPSTKPRPWTMAGPPSPGLNPLPSPTLVIVARRSPFSRRGCITCKRNFSHSSRAMCGGCQAMAPVPVRRPLVPQRRAANGTPSTCLDLPHSRTHWRKWPPTGNGTRGRLATQPDRLHRHQRCLVKLDHATPSCLSLLRTRCQSPFSRAAPLTTVATATVTVCHAGHRMARHRTGKESTRCRECCTFLGSTWWTTSHPCSRRWPKCTSSRWSKTSK